MRLWSLHPRYLDAKGLVAAWREALLAQAVLRGATRGYRHHPQLARFQTHRQPIGAVADFLRALAEEATVRGYRFDARKIARVHAGRSIRVTIGQLRHEWTHLRKKLRQRDLARLRALRGVKSPDPHPLFRIVPGRVESWEVIDHRTEPAPP
jgi:hypothetical protein